VVNIITRTIEVDLDEEKQAKIDKAYEVLEVNGYTGYIVYEEYPESPREDEHLMGIIAHWHRSEWFGGVPAAIGERAAANWKDRVGRKEVWKSQDTWDEPSDFQDEADKKGWLYLSVGLLDHSGWHCYAGGGDHWCDPGGWDSGTVGFIYTTRERILECYGGKRVTKKMRERALRELYHEIETLDDYYNNRVFGYQDRGRQGRGARQLLWLLAQPRRDRCEPAIGRSRLSARRDALLHGRGTQCRNK
jgi:hypothetical protein